MLPTPADAENLGIWRGLLKASTSSKTKQKEKSRKSHASAIFEAASVATTRRDSVGSDHSVRSQSARGSSPEVALARITCSMGTVCKVLNPFGVAHYATHRAHHERLPRGWWQGREGVRSLGRKTDAATANRQAKSTWRCCMSTFLVD